MTTRSSRVMVAALAGAGACATPPAPLDVVEVTTARWREAIRSGETTCRMVQRGSVRV